MVKGFNWKNVHIICGNHSDKNNEMYVHEGNEGLSSFYACPKYIAKDGNRSCTNRIYTNQLLKIMEIIDDERFDEDGMKISVKGLKKKIRDLYFEVLDEKGEELWISIKNIKAIK